MKTAKGWKDFLAKRGDMQFSRMIVIELVEGLAVAEARIVALKRVQQEVIDGAMADINDQLVKANSRIAEVESDRAKAIEAARMLNTNLQGAYETMEQSDKQWKADSDRAERAEAQVGEIQGMNNALLDRAVKAEERLAEVVKIVERFIKEYIVCPEDSAVVCPVLEDERMRMRTSLDAALAHAHEEEKHE